MPPPLTREERNRGWLTLFDGGSLDCWNGNGWRTAEYTLALGDRTRLPVADGEGVMINDQKPAGQASDLVSRYELGDCEAKILFAIPRGGNSGVYFMGRYEVQILDSFGKPSIGFGDCGGIYEGPPAFAGQAPRVNASREPCDIQKLEVVFQAPRFDAAGNKTANAKFVSVKLNDQLVQEDVEVAGPTRGGYDGEVPRGPLRLQGDHGPVAYDTVNVRAAPIADDAGWQRLWNGSDLAGWKVLGKTQWQVDHGDLVGRGGPGSLLCERADLKDLEWRARVKIDHGGSAALALRSPPSGEPADGYALVISSSGTAPLRTGSVTARRDLAILKNRLVPPDVWCTLQVTCADVADGVHIVVRVNDVVVTDVVDQKRQFESGQLLLASTTPETVVSFRDVEVRVR
ncbi:MAG: family 16 glycoside hydrolase [Planctomycetota bacterium]